MTAAHSQISREKLSALGISLYPDTLVGVELAGLSLDSRSVGPGSLFAAFSGSVTDGRKFIPNALEAGASALLIETAHLANVQTALADQEFPILTSDDPRLSFAQLCREIFGPFQSTQVAITGTNGKTSVAHFLRQAFEALGNPALTVGTLGLVPEGIYDLPALTTPDSASLAQALAAGKAKGFEHLCIEASSHGLDQRRLDLLNPQVAVFTNLTRDHLDYHETMEAYGLAKKRLFTELLTDGGAIVGNIDDPFVQDLKGISPTFLGFGYGAEALVRLVDVKANALGQSMTFAIGDEALMLDLPLIGDFQALNIAASIAVLLALKVPISDCQRAFKTATGVPGRMEIAASNQASNNSVVVDYAHTPDALETALKSARPHTEGRLITVFGAGGDRDPGKRPLMGAAGEAFADLAIVTDDNPRSENPASIRAQVVDGSSNRNEIGDRRKAIEAAMAMLKPGDLLLVAGKGHEDYQEIQGVKHPFDDRHVAAEIAQSLWKG